MTELNWDTQVLISVSQGEDYKNFKAARLPFKNLLKVACTSGVMYCASTFRGDKREASHWNPGAQIIVIDFDEGLNAQTWAWLEQQFGFLIPTRNHKKNKNGKVCERYRAILLADQPMMVSAKEFVNIYKNLLKDNNLPADSACTDVSRLYYSYGSPENIPDIKVLKGKPIEWRKYNYEDSVQFMGLPKPKKIIDLAPYEDKIDLRDIQNLNHSKRYECPICALEGLDPNKHHLGFSPEKDLLTCFYDNENHSPILRALYRKQVLGLDPEFDPETQEIVEENVVQADGKVKKKRVTKPKMEPCTACNGTGKITCTDCGGSGFIVNQTTQTRVPCSHCEGAGFHPCPECEGTGKVPKKPKPRVKKPSLPDEKVPLRDRHPKGVCHFNELGATVDFDAEYEKYINEPILGFDFETYYAKEVTCTEEECKAMFKDTYQSISSTYKRVVKNLHEKAKDEIDNTVRLFIIGSEAHQTAFDLSICTPIQKQKLFALIKDKLMIGHNLKFDIKSLASEYGYDVIPNNVFDTMLGSKMIWMAHHTFEPFENNSYKNVVKRYMGIDLPKDQGGSDWGADNLTMEQLIYAVNDVRFLIPIFKRMIAEFQAEMQTYTPGKVNFGLVKPHLGPLFDIHPVMALEMRFVLALARIELHGVMINESSIRDIVKDLQEQIKTAENTLGFNPGSNPNCLAFVKKKIGPQMTSASKEALAEYYHIPEIEMLGRAKQAKARVGLLVKMYDKKADGRIHTQFTQILSTARLASKEPNMQQIPRTVKDYIYRAAPGCCVFSADYPAIELRLGAVVHLEPAMIKAFREGDDLHYMMAHIMTGKPIPMTDEEKHDTTGKFINKEERTAAKNANFGYIYGGSWKSYQQVQLVKNHIKISDKDAQKSRADFMGLYKTINLHVEQVKDRFKRNKVRNVQMRDSTGRLYKQTVPYYEEINTLFGRRIAVESANTALNYPVQGSGGDACKLAVILFEDYVKEAGLDGRTDAYLVNLIHDDIVAESKIEIKAQAKQILARAMNDAANCLMGAYFNTDVSDEVDEFAESPLEATV